MIKHILCTCTLQSTRSYLESRKENLKTLTIDPQSGWLNFVSSNFNYFLHCCRCGAGPIKVLCEFLEFWLLSIFLLVLVPCQTYMRSLYCIAGRQKSIFKNASSSVVQVFQSIFQVFLDYFFLFCQSCLRMVWSLEVYKYWIGPLGELRVARDGPGIRTSSRKLLLADRTCPYNSF